MIDMKLLYLDPYINSDKEELYPYYGGLYHSLCNHAMIKVYSGVINDYNYITKQIDFFPDVVLIGLSYFEKHLNFNSVKHFDVPSLVHLFKPQNDFDKKLAYCEKNDVKHIVTPIPTYKQIGQKTGIPCSLFPYGYNPKIFKARNIDKTFDVGFSGMLHQNKYYPKDAFPVIDLRKRIGEKLNSNKKLRVFWKGSDDIKYGRINNILEYARTIYKCKIWIATPAALGDMTPRYNDIMGSKTILLCSEIPSEYKNIFIDTVNCVEFKNDLSDFNQKLDYILNTPEYYQNIVETAYLQTRSQHTWDKRANNLLNTINDIVKGKQIINHQSW